MSSWIKKTLFFLPYLAVPISEPQKSVSWPSGLGSWVQMRPLAGSSHVCRCCLSTLVLSVCHLCVSPPSPQWGDEVPFPSWNLLTWWGVFQVTFQPPLLPGFHQCVSFRTFLHQFLVHSHFYTFLKPASYLTQLPVAPNLFLQFLHFSRLRSLTLSSP